MTTVDELGAVVGGGTPSREVPGYWGGDIPWVTPGELTRLTGKFLSRTRESITRAGMDSCGARLLPPGSLLVTSRATLGSVAIAAQFTSTNQGFKSIVFRSGAEPSFYFHVFRQGVRELTRRASGTTFLEIPAHEFREIRLPRPPLAEQREIAHVLDTVDEAIGATEQLIAKLQRMKQGLLHDLLTRGIDHNGELRDAQRHPGEFKTSTLGLIPREWTATELGCLVDDSRPIVYGILMPGTGHPGGVPVVKVKDIVEDQIRSDDLLLTSPSIDAEYDRSRLRPGDLLFTIRGTVGRMAFVPKELDKANITQDTARLAIRGTNPSFVRHYLSTPVPRRFIETHTIGVAVRGINLRDVRRIPVAVPQRKEVDEITSRLDAADSRLRIERDGLAKLHLVKRGLGDDLIAGRVRVTRLLDGDAA